MPINRLDRYNAVAVALHWVIAFAIIFLLCLGFYMNSDLVAKGDRFALIQLHKSVGIVVLWLVTLRVFWRLTHKAPKLPANFPWWEKAGAHLGHLALYVLMIAMPLSGWLMVSSSPTGLPTLLFHAWQWPHFPGVAGDLAVSGASRFVHNNLPWFFIGVIALHVLAVVKHAVIDRENILPRMWFASGRTFVIALLVIAGLAGAGVVAANMMPVDDQPAAVAPKPQVAVGNYIIDYPNSKIEFGFTHTGTAHTGTFGQWSATIDFDEAHPETARINATIDVASAKTGDMQYDGTLPEADWLDAKEFPQATFWAYGATPTGQDKSGEPGFVAHGSLTLRGQTKPLDLDFTVTPTGATATATLHRLDYGIGAKSDDKADWVGGDITLTLTIIAKHS